MGKFSYKGRGDGLPFDLGSLTPALVQLDSTQSGLWDNERNLYMGPFTAQQMYGLIWQVRGYSATFNSVGFSYQYRVDTWVNGPDGHADDGYYHETSVDPDPPGTDSLSTPVDFVVPGSDESSILLYRNNQDTADRIPFVTTGPITSDSGMFNVFPSLGFLRGSFLQLHDNDENVIPVPALSGFLNEQTIILDDTGQYYCQWPDFGIGCSLTDSIVAAHTPLCSGEGDTVFSGEPPPMEGAIAYYPPDGNAAVSLSPPTPLFEVKVDSLGIDVTGPGSGTPNVILTANKFWGHGGRFDTTSGLFLGF